MKHRFYHLILIAFVGTFLFSCSQNTKSTTDTSDDSTKKEDLNSISTENETKDAENMDDLLNSENSMDNFEKIYEYIDEATGYSNELALTKKKGSIDFQVTVKNSKNGCESQMSGTATLLDGDLESRESSDGEEVFVNQYDFEGKGCSLSILIDLDAENKAWVEQWDCTSSKEGCEYGAPGMLEYLP